MQARPQEYFSSLSAELDVQANRVRSLIGSAHWPSDGAHKEALLRGLVASHAPFGTAVGRGFLISPTSPEMCSRELDILLVDGMSEMPLFNYGGLIIASCEHAVACLSVKSSFEKAELLDSLQGFASIPDGVQAPFFGSYHFDGEDPKDLNRLGTKVATWLSSAPKRVPLTCRVSPSTFFILETTSTRERVRLYRLRQGATAYFFARLLTQLATSRGNNPSSFADALDAAASTEEYVEVDL